MPTFSPTTAQQLLPPQPSTAGSAPLTPATTSSPGNPWAHARERMHAPVGADFTSCPTSAGVSDASTIPMQPVGATPPGLGQFSSSSPAYACPAMGTPGYPPMQPMQGSGSGGRNPADEVRKDRTPIPKLVVKGGDPTTLTRVINEWIQKTTISLNAWSQAAAAFWAQVVSSARQRHNWWLSLAPDQRATHIGLPTSGQTILHQLPLLEATTRAGADQQSVSLCSPREGHIICHAEGSYHHLGSSIFDLSGIPTLRTERLSGWTYHGRSSFAVAKNFQEALSTLRSWRQQVITVVNDLGGNPEPLKLLSSLKVLISSLVNSDNYRTTQVKVQCTDASLLQVMGLLELSARAQEDDEERRRKGQARHVLSPAEAGVASKGKGKGKGGKGKTNKDDAKGKGKGDESRPICTDYLNLGGRLSRGYQCTYRRPPRVGKCLRCGRPRRDAQPQVCDLGPDPYSHDLLGTFVVLM